MKTWVFACIQAAIALVGLIAYFYTHNMPLTALAAVSAAVVGISQPLLAARKQQQVERFQQEQHKNSLQSLDTELQNHLSDSSVLPLPYPGIVRAALAQKFPVTATELFEKYQSVRNALESGSSGSATLTREFANLIAPWNLGSHLNGLVSLRQADYETALDCFAQAMKQGDWIAPWIGWATALFEQNRLEELSAKHPHMNGLSFMPYGPGDEGSWLSMTELERDEASRHFQKSSEALGNFYTAAQIALAREKYQQWHEEYKKIA